MAIGKAVTMHLAAGLPSRRQQRRHIAAHRRAHEPQPQQQRQQQQRLRQRKPQPQLWQQALWAQDWAAGGVACGLVGARARRGNHERRAPRVPSAGHQAPRAARRAQQAERRHHNRGRAARRRGQRRKRAADRARGGAGVCVWGQHAGGRGARDERRRAESAACGAAKPCGCDTLLCCTWRPGLLVMRLV